MEIQIKTARVKHGFCGEKAAILAVFANGEERKIEKNMRRKTIIGDKIEKNQLFAKMQKENI